MWRCSENLDKYEEMATIGKLNNYKIQIFAKEGPSPHFHFFDTKTGLEGCICLLTSEYFWHNSNKSKQLTLNLKEKKELMKFLVEKNNIFSSFTNWKAIVVNWNFNNPDHMISENISIPNYLELK